MKDKLKNLKIGVLMGGNSAEREISLKTGTAVLNSLLKTGYNAKGLDFDGEFFSNVKKIDLCFIALHGTFGEDGRIQAALEVAGVPYTGSGVSASAIGMDKIISKVLFTHHNLKVPPFISFKAGESEASLKSKTKDFSPPYFVKPNAQGSSIGASIVYSAGKELAAALNNALNYDDEVLIEKYIKGREIQFAVMWGKPLGCVEVMPGDAFYSYEAKYTKGKTKYELEPSLTAREYKACELSSVTAHNVIRCKGVTRTDLILDENGSVYVLEINTLPGLTELSIVPMIAQKRGISFDSLMENILEDAII